MPPHRAKATEEDLKRARDRQLEELRRTSPKKQPRISTFYEHQLGYVNAYLSLIEKSKAFREQESGDSGGAVEYEEIGDNGDDDDDDDGGGGDDGARRRRVAPLDAPTTSDGGGENDGVALQLPVKIAIYGSFGLNVMLFIFKLAVAASSGSLAVAASALDSFLDIFSGCILFITTRIMQKHEPLLYPAGKSRLEPLGIIVFASVMFTATMILMIEAVRSLAAQVHTELILFDIFTLAGVVIIKFCMFIYCRLIVMRLRRAAEGGTDDLRGAVLALAKDHRNDVLTNTVGAGAVITAFYVRSLWWLDATAAILISAFIMFTWGATGIEHVRILSGRSAPQELLNRITFLAMNHRPDVVLAVDTVRAFHLAFGFLAEVDIVLPPDTPLRVAHDVGEELQWILEALDEIERAFVHLDYETEHEPEHRGGLPYHLEMGRRGKHVDSFSDLHRHSHANYYNSAAAAPSSTKAMTTSKSKKRAKKKKKTRADAAS